MTTVFDDPELEANFRTYLAQERAINRVLAYDDLWQKLNSYRARARRWGADQRLFNSVAERILELLSRNAPPPPAAGEPMPEWTPAVTPEIVERLEG